MIGIKALFNFKLFMIMLFSCLFQGLTDVDGRDGPDGRGRTRRTWTDGTDGTDGTGRGRTGRTWTDGTDVDGRDGRCHFRITFFTFFSKPNERNSPEIPFIWTLAGRVRNADNFLQILCIWTLARLVQGKFQPHLRIWHVHLNGIPCALYAFRTLLAWVQMNRISGEFRSFGL